MTIHNVFGDAFDRDLGPDPDDLADDQEREPVELDADESEPAEDPGAYATDEEYHASVWAAVDLTALLNEPTWPLGYDEERDEFGELREEFAPVHRRAGRG